MISFSYGITKFLDSFSIPWFLIFYLTCIQVYVLVSASRLPICLSRNYNAFNNETESPYFKALFFVEYVFVWPSSIHYCHIERLEIRTCPLFLSVYTVYDFALLFCL